MAVGLGGRLAALRTDVEQAIATYPAGDTRYLTRLEEQHERLQNPDLELVVRLVTALCAEDPLDEDRRSGRTDAEGALSPPGSASGEGLS
jgi:hypothetical protein